LGTRSLSLYNIPGVTAIYSVAKDFFLLFPFLMFLSSEGSSRRISPSELNPHSDFVRAIPGFVRGDTSSQLSIDKGVVAFVYLSEWGTCLGVFGVCLGPKFGPNG
jgi:hypothetical protein